MIYFLNLSSIEHKLYMNNHWMSLHKILFFMSIGNPKMPTTTGSYGEMFLK